MARIYKASEENGADHWVMAQSKDIAKEVVEEHIKLSGGDPMESGILMCEPLGSMEPLTLCCDRKPIVHLVEDWVIIYEGEPYRYLACSEY